MTILSLLTGPTSTALKANTLPNALSTQLASGSVTWLTILGILLAVIGAAVTIYYGVKSNRLERAARSLTWQQIQLGAKYLLDQARKRFQPEIILCVSGPGAVVTHLALAQADWYPPVFVAIQCDSKWAGSYAPPQQHELLNTTKWDIYIPQSLLARKGERLLLMVECVITGDSHAAIIAFLQSHGWPPDRLFTVSLVCSKIAIDARKAPEVRWWETSLSDFYFPWGKWY